MTNAELLATIRAEIDKLYGEYKDKFHQCGDQYHLGLIDGLDMAERVLDTLESEKPMNLEDAMKELDKKIALVKQRGTWDGVDVDKYMDEVRGRESENPVPNDLEEAAENHIRKVVDTAGHPGWDWTTQDIADAFIAGAKWQEEKNNKDISEKIAAAYQLGLADKEKQMMSETVEVRVQTSPLNGPLGISAYCCNFPSNHPFYHCKEGDKVRIIIVKEDGK